mmetsp:Transcript_34900/g.55555  ORF Transcript_34900/g.55555 Transcript_34900/m.55555 type:complete len:1315 (+) Transcript_34900:132-4076(+)
MKLSKSLKSDAQNYCDNERAAWSPFSLLLARLIALSVGIVVVAKLAWHWSANPVKTRHTYINNRIREMDKSHLSRKGSLRKIFSLRPDDVVEDGPKRISTRETSELPVVSTQNHLLPFVFRDEVPQSHGKLGEVVQWEGYPYEEESISGFSQYKLPKKADINTTNDEYFQEYVEEHMPILGKSSSPPMIHVKQRHDPTRSFYVLPFGPNLRQNSHCWGKCAWYRHTYGYSVDSVQLVRDDATLDLYLQSDHETPIHSCSGEGCGYEFGMKDMGHWFVAVATPPTGEPEVHRVYVSFPNICGQGLFTKPELTCSPDAFRSAETAALESVSDLLASTPKVLFGMEIEGNLRMPYKGKEKAHKFEAVQAYYDGNRKPGGKVYDEVQKMYEEPELSNNLHKAKSCFNHATGDRFSRWDWESENKLLQPEYVSDADETWGVPFEITPGNPPDLMGADGLKKVVSVVAGLESVGNQAGFDNNVDVHLMVRQSGLGQREWTDREIARFWIGYAKYQYAIDELHASSRVQNHWGQGLYAWAPKVQYMFQNLHRLVHNKPLATNTPKERLCDSILGFGECDKPEWGGGWPSKHTPFKYHSINFAILKRFGSLEIKQHTATNNPERMARWVDIVLRMADAFRHDKSLDEFFDEDAETDLKQLHDQQSRETLMAFFEAAKVPESSRQYYIKQTWAKTPQGDYLQSCQNRAFPSSFSRLTVEHQHKRSTWPPVATTSYSLLPFAHEKTVPEAHGKLGGVVQSNEYPYVEEAIAGISQYVLPKKIDYTMDEYFQEYVEEHAPITGLLPAGRLSPLMHVEQHHDEARSTHILPFGPSLRKGACWGGCAWYRTTYGFAVERVELLQSNVTFELYLHSDQVNPIHSCNRKGCGYKFGMEDRGKWFVAVATPMHGEPELQRIYVSFPHTCGLGLFTQPELTCSPKLQAQLETSALSLLADLKTTPAVSFGMEIEGGLRTPYVGAEKAAKFAPVEAYFNGDRDPNGKSYDKMQAMYDTEQYSNLHKAKTCFNNATSNRFSKWNFESEDKVLQPEYVDDASEIWAVPFEITAPNPPKLHGFEGLQDVIKVMAGLESVGNQASPDNNFDVHIMVRKGSSQWTDREIARFWVGYVKFQYGIDELHASSRVQNHWGQGLYMWAPKVQYMFQNIHRLVKGRAHDALSATDDLCDGILGYGECDSHGGGTWPAKHTPFKYHSINFAILKRFGSLEIKQHTATNSPERVARWTDLVLRMADKFRNDRSLDVFLDGDVDFDLGQLHDVQARATMDELFNSIDLPDSSRRYYKERRWAKEEDGEWLPRCIDGGVSSHGVAL